MHKTLKHILMAGMLALLSVGCGDDDNGDDGENGAHGHEDPPADCKAISDACHPVDVGEGEISECHGDIAHHNDAELCAAEKERCIALCEAAAEAAGDAGTHDHEHQH